MKFLFDFVKKLCFAPFVLYVFNAMAVGVDLYIPVNLITVLVVAMLGIPGILMIVALLMFVV